MFQTEPNVWLLDHGPPGFGPLMVLVSALGTTWAYAAFAIVLAFGARLRPALVLTVSLVATAVAVDALKRGLALPRPEHVDVRISSDAVVSAGGAVEFWSRPPADTVTAVRAAGTRDFGMPSGHVASASVFALLLARWPTTSISVGPRARWWLAAAWIATMALSRVALGKHFLADILGGLALGGVMTLLVTWLDRRARADHAPLLVRAAWLVVALAGVAAVLGVDVAPRLLGNLAGVAVACAWILPAPPDGGDRRTRIARIVVAAGVFAGGSAIAVVLAGSPPAVQALLSAVIVCATLVVPFMVVRTRPLGGPRHA